MKFNQTEQPRCIVCEAPTLFTVERGGIEAGFCPLHIPAESLRKIITLEVRIF